MFWFLNANEFCSETFEFKHLNGLIQDEINFTPTKATNTGYKILNRKLIKFREKWLFFSGVMQIYTKFANFTGLYFPHFTTIRNQTLQLHPFKDALSSYGNEFRSSCLDQNFVIIHPLFKAK